MLTCETYCEFYEYSEPVAAKEHRCCECHAKILNGEKHFRWVGKWEGEMNTGRQHFACMEACMFIRDSFQSGECIPFGCLLEWWYEYRQDVDKKSENGKRLRSMLAKIKLRAWRGKVKRSA